jgi:hypothetical protein
MGESFTYTIELSRTLAMMAHMMMKSGVGVACAGLVFVLCAAAAVWLAHRLVRSNRASLVARLPAIQEQNFTVKEAGELVVSLEVPQLTTAFRDWEVEVTETQSRRIHRMRWGGPRSTGTVKGFSAVKVPIGRLLLTQPETLNFRLKGLAPGSDYASSHIVLARPHLTRMALQIAGIVLCAVGALLCLLWGLWQLGLLKTA